MNPIIISVIVFFASLIVILMLRKQNPKCIKKHPRGDYVLKIIINKEIRNDLKLVLDIMKESLFNLIPKLMEDRDLYSKWRKSGEAKIVLSGLKEDMKSAYENALLKGITATKYELEDKSLGLVVIGPGLKPTINEFTLNFKLF